MRTILRVLGTSAVACTAGIGACSGPAVEPAIQNEPFRTHVVATVERHATAGQTNDELSVLLSALRMPQTLNSNRLLRLMGLLTDLPPVGSCEVVDLANRASPSLSSVERIELLDVGDVSVASGKRTLRLARQAFPTVTDFISGVVYTTRDKHTDLLPANEGISIAARGASKLKPFTLEIRDVPRLERVQLDGVPLAQVTRLSLDTPFELQWASGSAEDVVWLEFAANNGRKVVSCAFADAAGNARVPGALSFERGEARLTIHRLHSESVTVPGFDRADVRFDTRIAQAVTLY